MAILPDFSGFVTERLNATVYDPGERSQETQAFIIAQESARQLTGWANGLTNARGDIMSVEMGFVERMTPNALADCYNGHHYIGMHQALLVTIMEFALFAFTQRDVFPHIGNAAGEDSPAPTGARAPGLMLLEKTLAGESVETAHDQYRVPNDEQRHVAAVYLAMLMARFVWMHELAHCTNGHIGFVQNAGLALRLYEVAEELSVVGFTNETITPDQRSKILRTLEYDADSSAFFGCCQIQLTNIENIDGIKPLDLGTRLGLTIFGAYSMTWLFEEFQNFMNHRNDMTHPAPYDRLRNITHVALRDIAPKVDGFVEFHQGICDQFNALASAIPSIHTMENIGQHNAQPPYDDAKKNALQKKIG